jgi:NAD+ kinase
MAKPKVVIVTKRTAIERFVEEGKDPRVAKLLRRSDPSVRRWQRAHDDHLRTLERVERVLERLGAQTWLVRGAGGRFDERGVSLVVSVGGDGTLLSASHNVRDTPLLGVNSSPRHSIGFFCAARRANLKEQLSKALQGELPSVRLARMKVVVDGRVVSRRVLNEALFCHAIPAATSRYIVRFGRQREEQSSSGLWLGTAAGSTGALRSAGGRVLPLTARDLQFVAREPYVTRGQACRLTSLVIPESRRIVVQNKMQDACLFLDGPFKRVAVAIGETMTFNTSDESLNVLGLSRSRRPRGRS